MNTALLEAVGLSVMFGLRPVLTQVNLRLEPGRAALIIGANSTGKSTLVHALCGLVGARAGQVRVFGQDVCRLKAQDRLRLGVMLHRSMLYGNLTARENLEFYARVNACEDPSEHAARWLKRLDLEAMADERARDLSRGMEQRLSLARAMVAAPELVLFDEPFTSLDPPGAAAVGEVLQELLQRGGAALLTAHEPLAIKGVEPQSYQLVSGRLIPVGAQGDRRTVWRWMLS